MNETIEDIVIVGGGPAGAYLGYLLAKNGLHPVIFDHTHPREKPCGGGISVLAIEKFPILSEYPEPKASDNRLELIASKGISVMTSGKKSSWSLSRASMDKYLLDRALQAGCRLIPEQVINIKLIGDQWEIKTRKNKYHTNLIIGADGVNSIVRRKILGPIPNEDIGVCYGCFATSNKKETTRIIFLKKGQGYAWCFPRYNHLSIGVGVEFSEAKNVKKIFKEMITTYYPHVKIQEKWGAKIPNIKDTHFFRLPTAGSNWILIGDAAGHVDPTTGEGITYALWSADLASQAIINSDPRSYDNLWRKEYSRNLIGSCTSRDIFYNPRLQEYSIRLANKSTTLSTFFYKLITNQIPQDELIGRIVQIIPRTMLEYLRSKT